MLNRHEPLVRVNPQPKSGEALLEEFQVRAETAGLRVQCSADGAFEAKLAIVAEAPGETEVRTGSPLSGGSGKLLWTKLRKYGIERRHCWVTNVVKRQVALSRDSGDRDGVPRHEGEHWAGLLRWELSCLPQLRYVLVLGSPALAALSPHRGIDAWRGTVEERDGVWYIYTYNPANVLRRLALEPIFGLDVWKLDRVMRGHYKPHPVEAAINPSPKDVERFVARMRDERRPISVDIETYRGETACIGMANTGHDGMCVNFIRDGENDAYSGGDELRVRRMLQGLFVGDGDGKRVPRTIAQNGNFDRYWLWYKDRFLLPTVWFDTLLAHHSLYPQWPHALSFLTTQYTWHGYYKDERTEWRDAKDFDRFWRYNVTDAALTYAIYEKLVVELKKEGMGKFFFNHVMRLQPHLGEMTVNGVKCDVKYKDKIAEELRKDVDELREDFYRAAQRAVGDDDCNPNPDSPRQLQTLFFERLRLTGRGTSTDDENRKRILDHPRTPESAKDLIRALDVYKKESKFLSTYAEMAVDEDGRLRCEFRQFGTMTAPGRLSSSKTLWGTGMNFQNQPERAKSMFIADESFVFVYFDLSQAEARVVGWLAGIQKWIDQFEKARIDGEYDCHRALASEMFNVPYGKVPIKDRDNDGQPTIRFVAKRCRHGLNYRMAPDKLATVTGLSSGDAGRAWQLYHRITPELQTWWRATERTVRNDRILSTPYGRRLPVLGQIDDEFLKSVVAFVPQSTVGDHVSATIYLCHEDKEWPANAKMVLNIHDALIALVPKNKVQAAMRVMKKHAERPIIINGRPLIIPAEFAVSKPDKMGVHRWSTLEKVK